MVSSGAAAKQGSLWNQLHCSRAPHPKRTRPSWSAGQARTSGIGTPRTGGQEGEAASAPETAAVSRGGNQAGGSDGVGTRGRGEGSWGEGAVTGPDGHRDRVTGEGVGGQGVWVTGWGEENGSPENGVMGERGWGEGSWERGS